MRYFAFCVVSVLTIISMFVFGGKEDAPRNDVSYMSGVAFTPNPRGHSDLEISVPEGAEVTEIRLVWSKDVGDRFLDDCLDWVGEEVGGHDVPTHLQADGERTTVVRTHSGRPFSQGRWFATLKWLGGLGPTLVKYDLVEVRKEAR